MISGLEILKLIRYVIKYIIIAMMITILFSVSKENGWLPFGTAEKVTYSDFWKIDHALNRLILIIVMVQSLRGQFIDCNSAKEEKNKN